jgi:hypothetical protein
MGTTIKMRFETTSISNASLLFTSVWAGLGSITFAQESRNEADVDGSKLHLNIPGEEFHSKDSGTKALEPRAGSDATQWATLQPQLANE